MRARQRAIRVEAQALENGEELARMLGRMPSAALKEQMQAELAKVRLHGTPARFVIELLPPLFQAGDDRFAITRELFAGGMRTRLGFQVGELMNKFDVIFGNFEKRGSNAKDVMAQAPYCPIAIIDHPPGELFIAELAHVTLSRPQNEQPLLHKLFWGQRFKAAAVEADELGDVFEVLAADEVAVLVYDRKAANAERLMLFTSTGVIKHVDRDEVDVLFRKKLFRSKTAASSRLGEQNELTGWQSHVISPNSRC
jgi:hypothetical protein